MGGHRKAKADTEESVYMNVIPMVDIMFLLLLFFMLTADFGARELEAVELAAGKTIKEDKQEEAKGRMNLNVYHTPTKMESGAVTCGDFDAMRPCREDSHWNIAIRGKRYGSTQLETWAKDEAYKQKKKDGKSEKEALDPLTTTELRIMIRADLRAPFRFIQEIQEAMAQAGIYKLEYGAAEPKKT